MCDTCAICFGGCCLACCTVGLLIPTCVVCAVGELALCPISLPCSVYRRTQYQKLIKDWYKQQPENIQTACDNYFDGSITYKTMNAKFGIKRYMANFNNADKANQDLKRDIIIIPKCIWGNNRYPWNTIPNKKDFFKFMDNMARGVQLIYGQSQGQLINSERLRQLLIQSVKTCTICMDDEDVLTNTNTEVTSCSHIFHTDCLERWYQTKRVCPMCKRAQNMP